MSSIPLGSKAETLARLAPVLRSAVVLPQHRLTLRVWRDDPGETLAALEARGWLDIPVIVRSSALDEAGPHSAGRYASLAGRWGEASVRQALEEVAGRLSADADQIFVQPCLQDVQLAGVVVTRDPSSGGHTTIVSYDDLSGRTDGITSGQARQPRTWFCHRTVSLAPPEALDGVLALAAELRALLARDALDIEFARAVDGTLYLLQVRPLELPEHPIPGADEEARELAAIARTLEAQDRPLSDRLGRRALFGTMPDWNPAEIVGVRPRPLDLSLYRALITDRVWAEARHRHGYRDRRGTPLLQSFGGLPYVDVRASFESFVPADLDEGLASRLVDVYLDRLVASPENHDKVEFAVVYACAPLDLSRRLGALADHGIDAAERQQLADSLRRLTNRVSAGDQSGLRRDLEQIRELEREPTADARDLATRIHETLDRCRRLGTLPFAGIARCGFIAVQLLDSLVALDVLDAGDRERFLASIRTVPSRMRADRARLSPDAFLARYGHLRPGTYDITSLRYDEALHAYFGEEAPAEAPRIEGFDLSGPQRTHLAALLDDSGLEHDPDSLLAFLREAIEGREHAKFVFTRSLSDALTMLVELGARHGLTRDALSYADIGVIDRLVRGDDAREALETSIREGRESFRLTRQLTLPPLLVGARDVFAFHLPTSTPNFVTQGRAEGPVVFPDSGLAEGSALEGRIAMLPSADPGHDWIFAHPIAAFVTMYGGYNSHMAIRASELRIPAVIGAGETLYRSWASAERLRIDCVNRRVDVLA